jgi:hypothetical protein
MDPRDKKRSSRTPFQSSISTASLSSSYVGCFPIDSPLAVTANMQRYTPLMLLPRGYSRGRMLVCGADYGERSKNRDQCYQLMLLDRDSCARSIYTTLSSGANETGRMV